MRRGRWTGSVLLVLSDDGGGRKGGLFLLGDHFVLTFSGKSFLEG